METIFLNHRMTLTRLVFLCFVLAACFRKEPGTPDFQSEKSHLQVSTVPKGSKLLDSQDEKWGGMVQTATWEVETEGGWSGYRQWIVAHVGKGYRLTHDEEKGLFFVRAFPGDTYQLTVEVVAQGPPLRVRFTLDAHAN